MTRNKNSRLAAAEIIALWLVDGSFPDRQLAGIQESHAFVLEVVNGVVRNRSIFDWLERRWLKKPPQPFFKAVLRGRAPTPCTNAMHQRRAPTPCTNTVLLSELESILQANLRHKFAGSFIETQKVTKRLQK